jgi:hypothetical protein
MPVRRDWATARRNRGVLSVLCLSCVLGVWFMAWPVRVRALEAVALACLNLIQIPSVFCDSFRIPLSYLLSSTLPCVLLLRNSPLHQPALFRHRQRPRIASYLTYQSASTPSQYPTAGPRSCASSSRNCCCWQLLSPIQRPATLEVAVSACL